MPLTFETLTFENLRLIFQSEDTLNQTMKVVQEGRVESYDLEGPYKLVGSVKDDRRLYNASITLSDRNLNMVCECGTMATKPCLHVLALLLDWVTDHDKSGELEDEMDFGIQTPAKPRPAEPVSDPFIFPPAGPEEIRKDWAARLTSLTVQEMRDMAAVWGGKLKGIVRDQVFEGMLNLVSAPENLAGLLNRLPADERSALDLICCLYDMGPVFNSGQVMPYLDAALAGLAPKARPAQNILGELSLAGLFSSTASYSGYFPVPLQVLCQPRVNPALFTAWNGTPAKITPAQPFGFAQVALRLMLLDHSGKLKFSGTPYKSDAWPHKGAAEKGIKELEIIPAPGYLESGSAASLARDLALPPEALGLAAYVVDARGLWMEHHVKKIGERLPIWLQFSPQEQSRRLFLMAAAYPSQHELDLARAAGFTAWRSPAYGPRYDVFLSTLGQARLRLVRLLAHLPPGQWIEIEALLRMLHGLQPSWIIEFTSRQTYKGAENYFENIPTWFKLGQRKVNPLNYEEWSQTYGLVYRAMLTHTLPWLGLIDLGIQNNHAVALRLSEFGEFLLGRRADFPFLPAKSEKPALSLKAPNLLALDLDAAPFDLIRLVTKIALPEDKDSGAANARSLVYRLDDPSLGQAFEAGWSLEAISAGLQAGLRAPLPAALGERVQRLWGRFGRLQIYEDMTLIELADDYALPELLAGTSLSQILLYTFSPRLVAVRSAGLENYVSELQNKGYTPRVEGGKRG